MSNYTTLTIDRLSFNYLDSDDELEIESEDKYGDLINHHYINKDQALEIINHLK